MLRELSIHNVAVIDALTVSFAPGLNVLTGETGAGKSILIDALQLVLGARSSEELLRSGEEEAVVEAAFDLSADPRVTTLLAGEGVHLTVDGQVDVGLHSRDTVTVARSPHSITLVKSPKLNYFEVLRTKLRWGER